MTSRWCKCDELIATVAQQYRDDGCTVHGPKHWRCVEQNGLWLCRRTQADELVIRLFAWFHDSRRENDYMDTGHGRRGAEYARTLRGRLFDLDDAAFEKLQYACTYHTDEDHSSDPTIGTCWDADRFDLVRIGVIPSPAFMSTAFGKEIAEAGSGLPFYSEFESENNKGARR